MILHLLLSVCEKISKYYEKVNEDEVDISWARLLEKMENAYK
jgi:hypothetical protein